MSKIKFHIEAGARLASMQVIRPGGKHLVGRYSAYELERLGMKAIRVAGEMRARQPKREYRGTDRIKAA